MMTLVKFFLKNYKVTIILSMMMAIFGIMGFKKLNAESYPMVNFAMAVIETRYDGAPASDVEVKITKPIEDKIREVSGLKDVRSISKTGFSSIFVRVDMDNEDEEEVMDELQKAVKSVVNLPSDLRDEPKYTELNSEEFPAIEIAILGDNTNRARDVVADSLKDELEDSKKIKNVRLVGFQKRRFNIELDEKKLKDYHIGLEEVVAKIQARNLDIPGGNLKNEGSKTLIRIEGKVQNAVELENVVIRSNFSGRKIELKDVARVQDGPEDATIYARHNGVPATIAVVSKKAGADTLKLVDEVNAVLETYKNQYKGKYEFVVYNNEAEKVKAKLAILNSNAISGLALVILFLFLFLPGRIGLMASMSLPLSIMALFGFMPMFGMNLDAITILAIVIALGMLVDNSVVISEDFARLRDEEGLNSFDAAIKTIKTLWVPITGTALTTIFAFIPMLVTKGVMGQFIKWIPIIVSLSLVICLLEAFFLLPMRLWMFGGKSKHISNTNVENKAHWFQKFIVKFEKLMSLAVHNRYKVALIFGVMVFGSLLLMVKGNKFILFPDEQTEIYLGRLEMPRGTTLEETAQEMEVLSRHLAQELGSWQREIVARAGISQAGPTDPKGATGDNHGLFTIYATKKAIYNINANVYLEKMRTVDSKKAKSLTFESMAKGPPVGEAINATFRSHNGKHLDLVINEIYEKMKSMPGVTDLKVNDILGENELKVKINYDKADQLGLSVSTIGNAIRTALSGKVVSQVTLNNKEVDLHVRYNDEYRKNRNDIENIHIMDREGHLVPLNNVAKIEESNGSFEIKRFDFKRSKQLIGDVDAVKMTSILANLELKKLYGELQSKYPDVSMVFGGQEESTKESMDSLFNAMVLALISIFAIMVFLFGSYLRPFIIMTTIPLGLVGFSIAFFLHQKPISFLAMIGVIGLAGIIVNSGIVLITFIDEMRKEGKMSLHEILVKASGLRLRAVLVTSLTTVSGLFPTAYGIGGSDSMLVPMTMSMAWGLTSGTILTLIWVPCAYAILEDFVSFFQSLLSRRGLTVETVALAQEDESNGEAKHAL